MKLLRALYYTFYIFMIKIIYVLRKSKLKEKDIWIISETETQFQDNGYAFFKYMRKNYPQKNVYYIIDKSTKNLSKLEKLGNILYFKSFKSIYYLFGATKILSTHGLWMLPQELGICRKLSKKMIKAEKVMLRHGIVALKAVAGAYNKKKFFLNDKSVANSKLEKEIIKTKLSYEDKEIILSGMPRLDELFDESFSETFRIFYMPTYRRNIKNEKEFVASEYYKKSKVFLEKILKINKKVKVDFYLHKEFQKYINHYTFDNNQIEVKKDYSTLKDSLKKCNVLVTDYSSICFDFLYMEKPIFFFLTDEEAYKIRETAYIDYDKYFKEIVCYNEDELIEKIKKVFYNQYDKKEILKLKETFFEYDDHNNCKRLYEELIK